MVNKKILSDILTAYRDGLIPKDAIPLLMKKLAAGVTDIADILPQPVNEEEINQTFTKAEEQLSGMKLFNEENRSKLLLALVMNMLRGRVEGRKIAEMTEVFNGK